MRLVINHLIWHHHLQPRRQHGAYLLLTADNGPPNKEIYHRPQVYYYRTVNQFSLDPVRRLQRQPAFALIRSWLALGDQALFFFCRRDDICFAIYQAPGSNSTSTTRWDQRTMCEMLTSDWNERHRSSQLRDSDYRHRDDDWTADQRLRLSLGILSPSVWLE